LGARLTLPIRPLLKRHRLVDAVAGKTWDRIGQAPISFEQRSRPQEHYDKMETNDGERYSELFHVPSVDRLLKGRNKAPIAELVIRIGPPSQLDIPAYVEGVGIAVALAKKFDAQVILDEETGEHRAREEWEHRVHVGLQLQEPISEENPPRVALSGPISQNTFERKWHAKGLRKFRKRPYHSYVLYLRAEPNRNLVAEAEAIARPLLKRHRLVDAAAGKTWDRTGQAPISFEQRSRPQEHYDKMETNDGERYSELFHVPSVDGLLKGRNKAPIAELVIRIGPPSQLDIPAYVEQMEPAYVEGVEIVAALAKKFDARVVFDEETFEDRAREDWESCVYKGQQWQEPAPVTSEQNPPRVGLSGAIGQDYFEPRWHTRGMRKFGLPDLVLEDYLPYLPLGGPTDIVATLLLSGQRPDEQTGDLVIRTDDPVVGTLRYGGVNPSSNATLRLVPARPFHGQPQSRTLEISFHAQPHPTLYERQMQVHLDLTRGPYREVLSSDERRSLYLAIARAHSRLKSLGEHSDALRAAGTRVFVAERVDLRAATAHMRKTNTDWTQTWYVVMKWPHDDGSPLPLIRLWQGDPRQGGDVYRSPNPFVHRGVTYEFDDRITSEQNWIEDVLVIDKNGDAEGGEVTELLETLLPALAKR
jgi:hypothetical protein